MWWILLALVYWFVLAIERRQRRRLPEREELRIKKRSFATLFSRRRSVVFSHSRESISIYKNPNCFRLSNPPEPGPTTRAIESSLSERRLNETLFDNKQNKKPKNISILLLSRIYYISRFSTAGVAVVSSKKIFQISQKKKTCSREGCREQEKRRQWGKSAKIWFFTWVKNSMLCALFLCYCCCPSTEWLNRRRNSPWMKCLETTTEIFVGRLWCSRCCFVLHSSQHHMCVISNHSWKWLYNFTHRLNQTTSRRWNAHRSSSFVRLEQKRRLNKNVRQKTKPIGLKT